MLREIVSLDPKNLNGANPGVLKTARHTTVALRIERPDRYTARQTHEQLKKQLSTRPATYLLGELDVFPLGGFDGSCPAMAQGPTRLARGEAFGKFVNQALGARHVVKIVPECGHNARCMFTSEEALPLLFPK
ncbi:MAG: hypothetical protein M3N54_14830 [Acidobacteriota bacterium]|nr:hypothetical protein [Acidobacteriota bacterium]